MLSLPHAHRASSFRETVLGLYFVSGSTSWGFCMRTLCLFSELLLPWNFDVLIQHIWCVWSWMGSWFMGRWVLYVLFLCIRVFVSSPADLKAIMWFLVHHFSWCFSIIFTFLKNSKWKWKLPHYFPIPLCVTLLKFEITFKNNHIGSLILLTAHGYSAYLFYLISHIQKALSSLSFVCVCVKKLSLFFI